MGMQLTLTHVHANLYYECDLYQKIACKSKAAVGNKTLLVRMYFSCPLAGSYLASLGDSSSSPDTSPQKDTEPQTIPRTKRMPEKPKGKYRILSITHLDYLLQP